MIVSVPPLPFPFRQVALVGFGLMGGSLAWALKALPEAPRVRAWAVNRRDLEEGSEAGVLDEPADGPQDLFPGSDLVVYATPVESSLRDMPMHRRLWEPGALVTDLGSLKAPLQHLMEGLGEGWRYVGSHPMAGGEGTGFKASRKGLYRGVRIWLAAGSATPDTRARMEAFWAALGARPRWTDAEEHDRHMVWVSHLPQLTANALAAVLEGEGVRWEDLGPGGRDMTRLAGSSSEMWTGILSLAGPELCRALAALEGVLGGIGRALGAGNTEEIAGLMQRTRRWCRGGTWK